MTQTLDYLAKDVEVSTDMTEEEWEDSRELARDILVAKDSDLTEAARFWCFVTAHNINWRGVGGVGVWEMYAGNEDDAQGFWQMVAGINGDWTLKAKMIPEIPKQFDCMVYSHDTPTGGARRVRFLTSKQLLNNVLLDGTKERLDELKEAWNCQSKPDLIRALENEVRADEVREFL